jgi:hypothetical protein
LLKRRKKSLNTNLRSTMMEGEEEDGLLRLEGEVVLLVPLPEDVVLRLVVQAQAVQDALLAVLPAVALRPLELAPPLPEEKSKIWNLSRRSLSLLSVNNLKLQRKRFFVPLMKRLRLRSNCEL